MTRVMSVVLVTMMATIGCSKQEIAVPAADAAASAPTGPVEIAFKSNPETPTMGENTFEVMLMQAGKPVDDAQVSVEFFMAAMPQMNMAEMRTKTDLSPSGSGSYSGKGQVMSAGTWSVTVTATRNGQPLATKKLTVDAK